MQFCELQITNVEEPQIFGKKNRFLIASIRSNNNNNGVKHLSTTNVNECKQTSSKHLLQMIRTSGNFTFHIQGGWGFGGGGKAKNPTCQSYGKYIYSHLPDQAFKSRRA